MERGEVDIVKVGRTGTEPVVGVFTKEVDEREIGVDVDVDVDVAGVSWICTVDATCREYVEMVIIHVGQVDGRGWNVDRDSVVVN